MIIIGFLCTMFAFLCIGMASMRVAQGEVSDYLLANRDVSPYAAGLSAVASNNSGFMFIGAIGFTYTYGLSAFWLLFAWVLGDYCSWFLVHKKLRERSEQLNSQSISGFLSHDGTHIHRKVQLFLGVLTVVFLTLYASAQLKAGGKALEGILGWDGSTGIYLGMIMVALYSFAGGIRASIWTDVAQSIVMLVAMSVLVVVCHVAVVPLSDIVESLNTIDPGLVAWTPSDATLGLLPYAMGWFFAGFGGIGQPHIIVRAMTVNHPDQIPVMRRTYFSWYMMFSIATFLVGLYSRIYFDGNASLLFDKETALPVLSTELLSPVLVGVVLASMFAATMSTADSQVLASSASVTQDILPTPSKDYMLSKVTTLVIVLVAGLLAFVGPDSVFLLVTIAWGLMMTCFAPIMILRVLDRDIDWRAIILSCTVGVVAMLSWTHLLGLGDSVFDGTIGFLTTMGLVWAFSKKR
jgi:sodium/proline symporter